MTATRQPPYGHSPAAPARRRPKQRTCDRLLPVPKYARGRLERCSLARLETKTHVCL